MSVSGNAVVVQESMAHGPAGQGLILQAGNSVDADGVRIVLEWIGDLGNAGGMYGLLPAMQWWPELTHGP